MSTIKFSKKFISFILPFSFLIFFSISSKGQFILNGTATQLDQNCYQLTPAAIASIASIWNEDQINLTTSFDFRFNMNLGCTDVGADGMVFVLNPSSSTLGTSGGDIGYGINFNTSLGVEFDTYRNDISADLDADHIAIIQDGNVDHNHPNNLAGPVQANATEINIEDCEYHPVRIIWDADNMSLEVYFDCTLRLSYQGDIVNEIFGGDPMVYWGFTASTGGETNVQSICFDSFESTVLTTNQNLNICAGEEIQLSASQQNINYSWTPSDGLNDPNSSNPLASPTENITYIGTGMDECENEFIDTFNIIVNTVEINFEISPAFSDTTLCEGQTIDLMIQTDATNTITWQDGSTNPSFIISQAGSYEVTIGNDCATATTINMEVESTNCLVSMPNVFTPDGDGLNDFFAPVSDGFVEILQFKIFNRWGNVVFDKNNQEGWDGTNDGKSVPSDVYVYTIELINGDGSRELLSGDVTLVR